MLKQLKSVYDRLPKEYLKFLRYTPDRILFGKAYGEWKDKISFDESITAVNLYETLTYAQKHTEYGKYCIKNITVDNVFEKLEELPCVTSSDIAENLGYYTSDEFNRTNSYMTTTGGTGGKPVTLLLSDKLFGIEWAHVHHVWSLAGYDRKKHIKLTLRGKSLNGNKLVEYNPLYNELIVDTFKVKYDNFALLENELKTFDIKYIHGYPSLVKEYMGYFAMTGYKPELNGILLASEGCSPEDKREMTDFFGCRVVTFYGQSERALMAVDVNSDEIYKVYTSYGYPRTVDGELVLTSFVNRAMPLINYKIGDGAEVFRKDGYIYMRNLTSRRGKDFIWLDRNKKIPTTSINLHSMIQNEIFCYQIYQKEYGSIEIRLVKKMSCTMSDETLVSRFREEMQNNLKDFRIDVRLVREDEIIKSERGKMRMLVQKIGV